MTITLTPYDAVALLNVCRRTVNHRNAGDTRFSCLHDAVGELERQIMQQVTVDDIEAIRHSESVNRMFGKESLSSSIKR